MPIPPGSGQCYSSPLTRSHPPSFAGSSGTPFLPSCHALSVLIVRPACSHFVRNLSLLALAEQACCNHLAREPNHFVCVALPKAESRQACHSHIRQTRALARCLKAAINLPLLNAALVQVLPHVNHQNTAMVFCCVMPFGNCDWIQNAWLVLGKGKVALQIPPGAAVMFPLFVFTHYNHKVAIKLRAQMHSNAGPGLTGKGGHYSIVFFAQSSDVQHTCFGSSLAAFWGLNPNATTVCKKHNIACNCMENLCLI